MTERLSKELSDRYLMHTTGAAAETVIAAQTRIEPHDWQQQDALQVGRVILTVAA